jgi:hypothetical protein
VESVYIETTIVSYLVARPSSAPLVAAKQGITREWWELRRPLFACFVSEAVLQEAAQGDEAQAARRLAALRGMAKLQASVEAEHLAEAFLDAALPERAAIDAAHLSIATVCGAKYLLTWNCAHLANAQILDRLEPIALRRGFALPRVCTPEELMGESNDDR